MQVNFYNLHVSLFILTKKIIVFYGALDNLGEETPDDDEIYNVIISLRKVSILYSCHNLNPCGLFDSLFQDIDECQSGTIGDRGLPHEVYNTK